MWVGVCRWSVLWSESMCNVRRFRLIHTSRTRSVMCATMLLARTSVVTSTASVTTAARAGSWTIAQIRPPAITSLWCVTTSRRQDTACSCLQQDTAYSHPQQDTACSHLQQDMACSQLLACCEALVAVKEHLPCLPLFSCGFFCLMLMFMFLPCCWASNVNQTAWKAWCILLVNLLHTVQFDMRVVDCLTNREECLTLC